MSILVDKPIDLPSLLEEVRAAGVEIDDLGTAGDRLVTYDEEGHTVDLDDERIGPVLAAHVVPEPAPSDAAMIGEMLGSIEFSGDEASEELAAVMTALTGVLAARGF